jgi:hypothetical protein
MGMRDAGKPGRPAVDLDVSPGHRTIRSACVPLKVLPMTAFGRATLMVDAQ